MTLKYGQGHWKVKLSEVYHPAKFDIYHIDSVRENRSVIVFFHDVQSAGRPAIRATTDHYIDSHFSLELKKQDG